MSEQKIVSASGDPIPPTQAQLIDAQRRRRLSWYKSFLKPQHFIASISVLVSLLTLVVLGGQLALMSRQTTILDRQATIANTQAGLMQKQNVIADTQQQLATRPIVVLLAEQGMDEWKFSNNGSYKIVRLSMRQIHFKKFSKSGWNVSASSTGLMEKDTLNPGDSLDIPFTRWIKNQTYSRGGESSGRQSLYLHPACFRVRLSKLGCPTSRERTGRSTQSLQS